MTTLTRRSLFAALAAVSAVPLAACARHEVVNTEDPVASGLDARGVTAIAASYTAATDDPVDLDIQTILIPEGLADTAAIKAEVAKDFAAGRMFVHDGWRLSHTEGQLFTILSRQFA